MMKIKPCRHCGCDEPVLGYVDDTLYCGNCGMRLDESMQQKKQIFNKEKDKIQRWKRVEGNYITPGGDPIWCCPVCQSEESWHIYGVEHGENRRHICANCGEKLLYPWEQETDDNQL